MILSPLLSHVLFLHVCKQFLFQNFKAIDNFLSTENLFAYLKLKTSFQIIETTLALLKVSFVGVCLTKSNQESKQCVNKYFLKTINWTEWVNKKDINSIQKEFLFPTVNLRTLNISVTKDIICGRKTTKSFNTNVFCLCVNIRKFSLTMLLISIPNHPASRIYLDAFKTRATLWA